MNNEQTPTFDGEAVPTFDDLPPALAAKDAAWNALEQAVDEWIESNPDPKGEVKTHEDIGFLPPHLPFGWMTADDWESIEQRANEIASWPDETPTFDAPAGDLMPTATGGYSVVPLKPLADLVAENKARAASRPYGSAEAMESTARPWQSEAINLWHGLDDRRAIYKVATGAGKTRLGFMAAADWLYDTDGLVVIVVPTVPLATDWFRTAQLYQYQVARYDEPVSPFTEMLVVTYNSLAKWIDSELFKRKAGRILLICDEVHSAGADGARKTFKKFQGDAMLGLSATPARGDGVEVTEVLNAPVVYELPLIQAIMQSRTEEDDLDYRFHIINVTPTPMESMELADLDNKCRISYHAAKAHLNDIGKGYLSPTHYSVRDHEPCAIYNALTMKRKRAENSIEDRNTQTINIAKHPALIAQQTVIFNDSIFTIERMNQMLMDIGLFPRVYHSGGGNPIGEDAHAQALFYATYPELDNEDFRSRLESVYTKEFAQRELRLWRDSDDVLLTCKALREGFNAPSLRVLIMQNGTNAVRPRVQTIGRVMRGSGTKHIFHLHYKHGGDERMLEQLIRETGLERHKIVHHIHGFNPALVDL